MTQTLCLYQRYTQSSHLHCRQDRHSQTTAEKNKGVQKALFQRTHN